MSGAGAGKLFPLTGAQRDAADPHALIWLSASAGTGKTQVLTARVFRLLLRGDVAPENILCLTFTKAGAAEMAARIHQRLARWVRMEPAALAGELRAIGLDVGRDELDPARQLFAKLLDAPGGGLRILTIHSFCQTLLSSFPLEAGMIPGFKAMEERDQSALAREALAELLVMAEQDGRDWLLSHIQELSRDLGEEGAETFLRRCAAAPDAMADVPEDSGAVLFARRIVGIRHEGTAEEFLCEACEDGAFDIDTLRAIHEANVQWGTKTGKQNAATIAEWIEAPAEERAARLDALNAVWSTKEGTLKKTAPKGDDYVDMAAAMLDHCRTLIDTATLMGYAERYARALLAGKAYAAHYAEAKRLRGLIDFDDLIRNAAALLADPATGAWIRYKLDSRIDHILVDEAQDTNARQWDIVGALTEEFFAGAGARDNAMRTLFTVGDFKQAIFGFQGTSPENYHAAREIFREKAAQAERDLHLLDLAQNFRSTQPVLRFVDAAIAEIGAEQLGLKDDVPPHGAVHDDHGEVLLLPPVRAMGAEDEEGAADSQSEAEEEEWLAEEKRVYAHRLARQIRLWLDEGAPLSVKGGRPLQPGDIMVLVRSRGELANLIVARLYAEGVPVAGIDRLRLGQPLAIQDVMAAIRFVLQPDDDLNLASLLVSPLMGWSQEDLLAYGYRPQGRSLWRHLRDQDDLAARIAPLRDLLDRADFVPPALFLEHILSGPMAGRAKIWARLGTEAMDPLAELMNAALQYEMNHPPSLQGFVHWFDGSDVEIKREGEGGRNEVRVMTVHGSKGLQAPLVILADAAADPAKKGDGSLDLLMDDDRRLPMLRVRKAQQLGQLGEAARLARERDMAEHWRLLYVAMTRAEERLVIGGSLGRRSRQVPEQSWYAALERTMAGMDHDAHVLGEWGEVRVHRGTDGAPAACGKAGGKAAAPAPVLTRADLPEWLTRAMPAEARPPRPLAPSATEEDKEGEGPPAEAMRRAARRGSLLHNLFERLPATEPDARRDAVGRWLARVAADLDEAERAEIADAALALIEDPAWAGLFGPDALAEVPVAAVVGETVIAGKVDRLRMTDTLIEIVDFKTGRAVPRNADEVSPAHKRQMAWYVAALEQIYPGRPVRAALLYTHGPRRIDLDPDDLAALKPA